MYMKTFMKESSRTSAAEMNREDFPEVGKLLMELVALDTTGAMADILKRNLFYKVPITGEAMTSRINEDRNRLQTLAIEINSEGKGSLDHFDQNITDVIHAALGIMSEAGEIVSEILAASVEGRQLDLINLREEAGDVLWYQSLLLRSIGCDFDTCAEVNINKLRARYPDQFTEDKAVNRNIDQEQEVLAQASPK